MCIGLMESCLRREGRGTVVHYGTRGPCLCSSLEKVENGGGTVVPSSKGTPCQISAGEFQDLYGLPVCVFVL